LDGRLAARISFDLHLISNREAGSMDKPRFMKTIPVEESIGTVLAHDITRIVPGQSKGAGFKKGHVVTEEDIPRLLEIGKRHLYVLDLPDSHLHENEAALLIARAISDNSIEYSQPHEGKSSLSAKQAGLLKIDPDALLKINRLDDIIVATIKTNQVCRAGQIVAGTRIIPLVIEKTAIERLEQIASQTGPVIRVLPFSRPKVGAVVTGSEIYDGLIADRFDDFVLPKLGALGCGLVKKIHTPDDAEAIAMALKELKSLGCGLIVTTGGLSVDPDDVTRQGVRQAGARTLFYGTPVLPGAMFLLADLDGVPVMGLPACVYYHPTTLFDLLLPRVLAGEAIDKDHIAAMGHGGLCLQCEKCRYPVCPFGK
jgi:hypothetical protein